MRWKFRGILEAVLALFMNRKQNLQTYNSSIQNYLVSNKISRRLHQSEFFAHSECKINNKKKLSHLQGVIENYLMCVAKFNLRRLIPLSEDFI